jgi:hypothetical protein
MRREEVFILIRRWLPPAAVATSVVVLSVIFQRMTTLGVPFLTVLTVAGLVVLVALVFLFLRTRPTDGLTSLLAKYQPSAKLASKAAYAEGLHQYPVVLALTAERIHYVNPDLDATLDLAAIDETEYDDELATGRSVQGKVLRIRSHGHTFEFVLEPETARQWMTALPPRRMQDEASDIA